MICCTSYSIDQSSFSQIHLVPFWKFLLCIQSIAWMFFLTLKLDYNLHFYYNFSADITQQSFLCQSVNTAVCYTQLQTCSSTQRLLGYFGGEKSKGAAQYKTISLLNEKRRCTPRWNFWIVKMRIEIELD